MSERILNALVQLFAIIARVDPSDEQDLSGRTIVESFLKERLPGKLVRKYLDLFEDYLETYQKISSAKNGKQKRMAGNSVKVLRICTEINEELTQRQKTIVLIRLLEFIYTHTEVSDLEQEFVNTVAMTFNFDMEEYKLARLFVEEKETELIASHNVMYVTDNTDSAGAFGKHLIAKGLDGYFRILRLPTVNLHFIKYKGNGRYNVSGQPIVNDRFYVLNQGASIRGPKISPIYYSDILGSFLKDNDSVSIQFRATGVSYTFKKGNIGLNDVNLEENSGSLVGIMGASGSGKSTLLNILNGNLAPKLGSVSINGIDIHRDAHAVEGVIGYIAQDDLLIEELTVFQNLFYNTKLCFGQKTDEEITVLVHDMLSTLGLTETSDLKVGNPLDKTISGGQRKRLNIALELIREPAVLFIDEPTSGLSSRDSENIMDLLKELCLKGKLIFVVIHQPSSDIFKMFDSLLVLDKGGYPIYSGNPVDSLVYFRKMVNHVNSEEAECLSCGNVKTEDVFNIIESKVVDEFGNLTPERKISPLDWNQLYKENIAIFDTTAEEVNELPKSNFTIPSKLQQLAIFVKRDVLSKLTNRQYVLINLLEAPVLAMILAFFMRFFVPSGGSSEYVFRENENIPVYIFISVIVALFIGLTVSSEEIIRDKKIRKRESFLNLSRGSYLSGKIGVMLAISAIQMFLFVIIGNTILEIKGMTLPYWAILFSTCTFANILGLNISASFNSAKVIYILIPIVIIPQLLFSGIIVRFDRLNPIFASQKGVPWIGNIMASRWAYEAIAVTQFKWNDYEENFYELERRKKFSNWKKDYWITELKNKAAHVSRIIDDESATTELESELTVLRNELQKENAFLKGIRFDEVNELTPEAISIEHISDLRDHLDLLETHYRKVYNQAESEKENAIYAMTREDNKDSQYDSLFDNYKNDQLEIFATNRNDLNYIAEHNGELIQKKDLIYLMPYNSDFFSAHFYAPAKKFFGNFIDTFFANLMVIWAMTIALILCLFFDVFPRMMRLIEDNLSLPGKK
ncbi:MAG: ABC-type multidrug transport system ATPase subunit [Flammeovirgaceae bacterium]|jgi:ABC-type multidrug transport system ATPase subunit